MQVDKLTWTLCGEVERVITFLPAVTMLQAQTVAKIIDYRNPEYTINGMRVG